MGCAASTSGSLSIVPATPGGGPSASHAGHVGHLHRSAGSGGDESSSSGRRPLRLRAASEQRDSLTFGAAASAAAAATAAARERERAEQHQQQHAISYESHADIVAAVCASLQQAAEEERSSSGSDDEPGSGGGGPDDRHADEPGSSMHGGAGHGGMLLSPHDADSMRDGRDRAPSSCSNGGGNDSDYSDEESEEEEEEGEEEGAGDSMEEIAEEPAERPIDEGLLSPNAAAAAAADVAATDLQAAPSTYPPRLPLALQRSASLGRFLRSFAPERCHLLVVDDEPLSQEIVAQWLAHKKYHVTCCNDGEEAVELLSAAAAMREGLGSRRRSQKGSPELSPRRVRVPQPAGAASSSSAAADPAAVTAAPAAPPSDSAPLSVDIHALAPVTAANPDSLDADGDDEDDDSRTDDFDLILCDASMESPGGWPLLEWVLRTSHTRHIPVILMATEASAQTVDRALRRGAEDFLRKPLQRGVLLKSIRSVLECRVEQSNSRKLKEWGDRYKAALLSEKSNRVGPTLQLEQVRHGSAGMRRIVASASSASASSSASSSVVVPNPALIHASSSASRRQTLNLSLPEMLALAQAQAAAAETAAAVGDTSLAAAVASTRLSLKMGGGMGVGAGAGGVNHKRGSTRRASAGGAGGRGSGGAGLANLLKRLAAQEGSVRGSLGGFGAAMATTSSSTMLGSLSGATGVIRVSPYASTFSSLALGICDDAATGAAPAPSPVGAIPSVTSVVTSSPTGSPVPGGDVVAEVLDATVLLVDPSSGTRALLSQWLASINYRLLEKSSMEEALECLQPSPMPTVDEGAGVGDSKEGVLSPAAAELLSPSAVAPALPSPVPHSPSPPPPPALSSNPGTLTVRVPDSHRPTLHRYGSNAPGSGPVSPSGRVRDMGGGASTSGGGLGLGLGGSATSPGAVCDLIIADAEPFGDLTGDDASHHPVDRLTGAGFMYSLSSNPATRGIPVLLMYSGLTGTDVADAIRHGVETILVKPVTKDMLLKKVNQILSVIAQKRTSMQFGERAHAYRTILAAFRAQREEDIRAGKRSSETPTMARQGSSSVPPSKRTYSLRRSVVLNSAGSTVGASNEPSGVGSAAGGPATPAAASSSPGDHKRSIVRSNHAGGSDVGASGGSAEGSPVASDPSRRGGRNYVRPSSSNAAAAVPVTSSTTTGGPGAPMPPPSPRPPLVPRASSLLASGSAGASSAAGSAVAVSSAEPKAGLEEETKTLTLCNSSSSSSSSSAAMMATSSNATSGATEVGSSATSATAIPEGTVAAAPAPSDAAAPVQRRPSIQLTSHSGGVQRRISPMAFTFDAPHSAPGVTTRVSPPLLLRALSGVPSSGAPPSAAPLLLTSASNAASCTPGSLPRIASATALPSSHDEASSMPPTPMVKGSTPAVCLSKVPSLPKLQMQQGGRADGFSCQMAASTAAATAAGAAGTGTGTGPGGFEPRPPDSSPQRAGRSSLRASADLSANQHSSSAGAASVPILSPSSSSSVSAAAPAPGHSRGSARQSAGSSGGGSSSGLGSGRVRIVFGTERAVSLSDSGSGATALLGANEGTGVTTSGQVGAE